MAKFEFDEGTAFDVKKAYWLAKAAHLAYDDEGDIEKQVIDEWKFKDFEFFDASGTQAYAMADKEKMVVAFRGTEPVIEDWLADLNLDLGPGAMDGEVHEGFRDALDSVWNRVRRTLSRFRGGSSKSVWFTGHSLGAALATLAVARLRDEDRRVDGLYTFGQPRTGDRIFARNFNIDFKSQTFRFVNNNDIVTRIPPRALRYSHVGTLKYLTENGKLVDDISWWWRFIDRIHGRIDDILEWGSDGLKDHSMNAYATLLGKIAHPSKKKSR